MIILWRKLIAGGKSPGTGIYKKFRNVSEGFLDGLMEREYDGKRNLGKRCFQNKLPTVVEGPQTGEKRMGKFRDKMARFMYGRYGADQLNRCLMGIVMVLLVVSLFFRYRFLYWLTIMGIALAYFRMLSKNIRRRSLENGRYLRATSKVRRKLSGFRNRVQDKAHRYYKCPSCRQKVRLPRGKGKICITCPKCGKEFIRKT